MLFHSFWLTSSSEDVVPLLRILCGGPNIQPAALCAQVVNAAMTVHLVQVGHSSRPLGRNRWARHLPLLFTWPWLQQRTGCEEPQNL